MPEASFDKDLNLPLGGGRYVKLTNKGDEITFRIAKTPHYDTKHWLGKREFTFCGKYNAEDPKAPCEYCDDHRKALEMAAEAKTEAKKKVHEQVARDIAPTTTFYYPILDIKTSEAKIFQFTAKSIHYTIKGYSDKSVDVFGCNWSVERTEDPGSYYKVLRLDKTKLSEEQEEALSQAKAFTLDKRESSSVKEEK